MPRLIAHPAIFPAAATALIIALVTMAMTIAGLYQSRAAMVAHTLEVERELARLFADLQEGELAARGYVLTAADPYLAAFTASRDSASIRIENVARLTADNPEQQADIPVLRQLAADRFDLANRAMGQRQAGAGNFAIFGFVSGEGNALTDRIRSTIRAMEGREARLASQRAIEERNSGRLLIIIGLLVFLASLVIIGLWFRDRQRTAKATQRPVCRAAGSLRDASGIPAEPPARNRRARRSGIPAAPKPEDGGRRPAYRRHRPRLQQHAGRDHVIDRVDPQAS